MCKLCDNIKEYEDFTDYSKPTIVIDEGGY